MADEQLLELFDSFWFEREIFWKKKTRKEVSPSTKEARDRRCRVDVGLARPKLLNLDHIFQVRSMSERCLGCSLGLSPDFASPRSVLGFLKETNDFSNTVEEEQGKNTEDSEKKKVTHRRRRRRRRSGSRIRRSLSDLEYEELKGFMDLGFVFTEEDKRSSLVSILPGLQRWGRKACNGEPVQEKLRSPRPYLSEAWGVLQQRKLNKQVMKWIFPATGDDNNIKEHLKAWAHTVASSVR